MMHNSPSARLRPLTDSQCTLMNYLWQFYLDNDQLPTCHAIARNFGWSSDNAAQEKLDSLYDKHGLLEKNVLGKWKFTSKSRDELLKGPYVSTQGEAMRELAKRILSMPSPRPDAGQLSATGRGV